MVISVDEIRAMLEGYCIDNTIVTDDFIQKRRDNFVIPVLINGALGLSVVSDTEKVIYVNGTGKSVLTLPDKGILEIVAIEYVNSENIYTPSLGNFILIADEGILKARFNYTESYSYPVFPKGTRNIKITYKVGYASGSIPLDLNELIGYLTVIEVLKWIEGRSGGGNVSSQAYSRQYGDIGKYTNIRRQIAQNCNVIIKRYRSSVI
jgi:hypothetical protein